MNKTEEVTLRNLVNLRSVRKVWFYSALLIGNLMVFMTHILKVTINYLSTFAGLF